MVLHSKNTGEQKMFFFYIKCKKHFFLPKMFIFATSFLSKKRNKMQVLKEYIKLIESFEFKRGEKEAILGAPDTKLWNLYHGIHEGLFLTDSAAAKALYEKRSNFGSYKTLKYELKKRLGQLVLIVDFKKADLDDYQQAYYEGYKNWATVNILYRRGKPMAALDLAETVLGYAQEYDLTDMIINSSHLLSHLYAHQVHDDVKMNEMRTLYAQYLPVLDAETTTEFLYFNVVNQFLKTKLIPVGFDKTTQAYVEQIKPYLEKYSSIRLHVFGRLVIIMDHLCRHEYEAVVKAADEAIIFLKAKGFAPERYMALFVHHKAKALLQLGRYIEGIQYTRMSLDIEPIGTHNWFNRGLTLMKLYLFTNQYQEAWLFFTLLIEYLEYQKQIDVLAEEFRIYEAYMQFLIAAKMIKTKPEDATFMRPYDPIAFNNSIMFLSKDKLGMNSAILVIQLLHLLIGNAGKSKTRFIENQVMELIASLEYYRNEYFRKSENKRHDIFVRLINNAVKGHFRRNRVNRMAEADLAALRAYKSNGDIYADMGSEILTHESVWELMGRYWD
jgi:hypothetical protein